MEVATMIIKNLTVGVINIEGKFVLPQQSVTVSDALKKNAVINLAIEYYIDHC